MVADAKLLKQTDKVTGKQKIISRQKRTLFIPGRIIHITRMKPIKKYITVMITKKLQQNFNRCFGLYQLIPMQAHWMPHSEFSELSIKENCVKHHTPDVVLKNMLKLQKQEHTLDEN